MIISIEQAKKEGMSLDEMGRIYNYVINLLKVMDEKQLIELFHDMEDPETVERIADCAYHFVENCVKPEEDNNQDNADIKAQDDSLRYRDIKSTQDSLK